MQALRLLPFILAALLLGAHLLRQGWLAAALAVALLPLLLFARRRWAVRAVEAVLLLGVGEWLRTMATLVSLRRAHALPFLRLTLILLAVAAVTALAAASVELWWRRRELGSAS